MPHSVSDIQLDRNIQTNIVAHFSLLTVNMQFSTRSNLTDPFTPIPRNAA